MPKLLRPGEQISFLQTRAPEELWRYVKGVALEKSADGTVTRLCTDNMLQFLAERRWLKKMPWLRPQAEDGAFKGQETGFRQINLPLSNLDPKGQSMLSRVYLREAGILDLADGDKHALKAALETGKLEKLIRVISDQLGVSGATFGYTYLTWLSTVKYAPTSKSAPEHVQAAAPIGSGRASRYAVKAKH